MTSKETESRDEDAQRQDAIAPKHFICPLTLELMQDPVMSRYGQSYERSAILKWLSKGNAACPMTRQPLRLQDLISNHQLKVRIQHWQKDNDFSNLMASTEEENDDKIYGYFTIEDVAERSEDDPPIVLEFRRDSEEAFAQQVQRRIQQRAQAREAARLRNRAARKKRGFFLSRLRGRSTATAAA